MVNEENRTFRTGKRLLDAPDRGKLPGLRRERGDERVADRDLGPEVGEFLDDLDGGRFLESFDVLLVGEGHDDPSESIVEEVANVHLNELTNFTGGFGEKGK